MCAASPAWNSFFSSTVCHGCSTGRSSSLSLAIEGSAVAAAIAMRPPSNQGLKYLNRVVAAAGMQKPSVAGLEAVVEHEDARSLRCRGPGKAYLVVAPVLQALLNVVWLRYADAPMDLDVASIIVSLTVGRSGVPVVLRPLALPGLPLDRGGQLRSSSL